MFLLVILLVCTQCVHSQMNSDLQHSRSYQTCKSNADCKVPNSFCNANSELCQCEQGFIIIRNRQSYNCTKIADSIGSDCAYNEQCEITLGKDSECDVRNQCSCKPNAHFFQPSNSCFKSSKLNETCVSNENCIPNHPDDEVFCTNGRCRCGLKRAPNENGRCAIIRRLGESCDNDDTCRTMNAVCRVVCTCRVGYVLQEDERYCLKAAENLLDECIQDSQCQEFFPHTECVDGRCHCKTNYHAYGNHCYSPVRIGSICQHKGECITKPDLEDRVDCVDSVCLCKSDLDSLTCGDISAAPRLTNFKELKMTALILSTILFILI